MIVEAVIDQLLSCRDPKGIALGNELKIKYENWKQSNIFDRKAFEGISKDIVNKRKEIMKYTPRADTTIKLMTGKLFEEYVSVLLGTMCNLEARNFDIFWDERITIWKGLLPKDGTLKESEVKFRHDIVIGREEDMVKKPYLLIECSKYLDLSILSKLAFRYLITKRVSPTIPCIIVTKKKSYRQEYEYFLSGAVDDIFDVSEKKEVFRLRDYVNKHLDKFA